MEKEGLDFYGAVELPGLALYYLFGLRRYAAGHTFPVEEGLPFHLEAAYNGGYELDPLPAGEGVEKGIPYRQIFNQGNVRAAANSPRLAI